MEHTKSYDATRPVVDNGWLAALRGFLAATAGLPGDIEGLGRAGINAAFGLGGVRLDPAPALPTTEFYRDWLPGKQAGADTIEQLAGLPAGAKLTSVPRAFSSLGKAIATAKHLPDVGLLKQAGAVLVDSPHAMQLEAIRYGKTARTMIDSEHFGGGLKGSSRDEYLNAADPRLAKRVYFYADKGEGITPEAGVGGIAHRAQLSNVYDADSDPLRLMTGNKLANESAILDAGFSGYLNRLEGSQPGQVVMLGSQNIPAEVLGPMSKSSAKPVPPAAKRPSKGRDIVIDQVSSNSVLPGGSLTPSRWGEVLDPETSRALRDAGVLTGEDRLYRDELMRRFREATPNPEYASGGAVQPLVTVPGFDPVYKTQPKSVLSIAGRLVQSSGGTLPMETAIAMAKTYRPKGA